MSKGSLRKTMTQSQRRFVFELSKAVSLTPSESQLHCVASDKSDILFFLYYIVSRAGFSWWEAWVPAYLGVARWETIHALGIQDQKYKSSK